MNHENTADRPQGASDATNRAEGIETLKKHLEGIRFAMLTTVDDDGSLHSRPMATQEMSDEGDLWFFTAASSEKVHEAQRSPWVNLSYSNPDSSLYLSVSGRAELVRDRAKIEELWNPAVAAYFPNGKDDPELALLRVDVANAEVWDSPSSKVVRSFNMLKAIVTGTRDEQGRHERIELEQTV
jgi:general stress protein 26